MAVFVYIAIGCDWPRCGEEATIGWSRRDARANAKAQGWTRGQVPAAPADYLYDGSPAIPARVGDICPDHRNRHE